MADAGGVEVPEHIRAMAAEKGKVFDVEVRATRETELEVVLPDGRVGVVERGQFSDPVVDLATVTAGTRFEAAVLARDDPHHRVVLSKVWAETQKRWGELEAAKAERRNVDAMVVRAVGGGLVVDCGVRGFIPLSLIDDPPPTDLSVFVGTTVEARVVEVNAASERLVLSRRAVLRQQHRSQEKEALRSLSPGDRRTGTVATIVEYGAFVDVDGVRGLVHRTELSWGRVNKVSDFVSVGDPLEVEVIEVNSAKRRVGLSHRRTQPDPLAGLDQGVRLTATITRVVEYGAFARVNDKVEGLIHLRELSDLPGTRPDELVYPGEEVVVMVISVDRDRRRVGLSIRQALLAE